MAFCVLYPSLFSENLTPLFRNLRVPRGRNGARFMANSRESSQSPTKLVTFLGKGGSGKTTAAVLAAKYYASEGLRTCLVIHSQDPTAEQLMGCKIGSAPTECSDNLSAVKLETSKMLLEPLNRMKKVDARLNLTQGVLQGVVGEELGVLPGMDSIFSALALQKLVNFRSDERNAAPKEFDMVIYDGISTEETLRLIGVTERARWYLKYMRSMSEKTDIGRLTSPSLLKLAYDSINLNSGSSEGKTSTDIWNEVEQILERASASFTDLSKFRCYLVMDPMRSVSISSALRYWGCAIQAGTHICGALGFNPQSYAVTQEVAEKFSPLSFALLPYIGTDPFVEWETKLDSLDQSTKDLLGANIYFRPSVTFDSLQKTVTLFMPGFDKSEVKLYQYRGGSELLVEAGDQRRIIKLPPNMHGKVIGAKFTDRNLVVKLR
ncbi:ATPase GET3D, chloroplastic [Typha angustifolia]|uniref:ATPase GET3D, chloroplastic n=1 Tax=Typha angustifolia TaxID=59011 RepID=UPI003C2F0946